jgi:diphosphomevalonate decarboxylase
MKAITTIAHPNIALIKYWGKRDIRLNLPAVPSVSLTLAPFFTRTKLTWGHYRDEIHLNGVTASERFASKVLSFLDREFPDRPPCRIETENNFPSGAGLASSSSGFAALSLAASQAAGRDLSLPALSCLARKGSGSACRSLWGGFVHWGMGSAADGSDCHGRPIGGADEWEVAMVVAIVSDKEKSVGSTEGMERSRLTSPYYDAWVNSAEADVTQALEAIEARDLERLGVLMESSTFKMHAAMHTSVPPLLYWQPATINCLNTVFELRKKGIGAWTTMDAGPQVKVLCMASDAPKIADALRDNAKTVHILRPGPGARQVDQ